MKKPQLTRLVSGQVVSDSAAFATALTTDWILAAGGTTLTIGQEIRQLVGAGTMTTAARHRFASVSTQRPGAWVTSASDRTVAGIYSEDVTISGITDQMWLQVGLAVKTASGVSECLGKVQGSVQGNGALVAVQTVEVTPINTAGQFVYVPLGQRFPQTGISKIMYAITFTGVSGTITYRPVYREVEAESDFALNWVDLAAGNQTQAGQGDVNLNASMTVTRTAGFMFGQAGIRFQGDARGTLQIAVAAVF